MFQFLTSQAAKLLSFTGRTEVHGPDRVPAVSFRLKFTGPNTLLDLLSPSLRLAVYTAAEGQEDLPGVEPATPLLRSKDVKHLGLDNVFDGWTVHVEHGIGDDSALVMGSCKIDAFAVDFYDGGTVDIECRVGTSDLDAKGAGLLWSKQTLEVKVMLIAPKTLETNPSVGPAIDGTKGHPGTVPLFDAEDEVADAEKTPEEALAEAVATAPEETLEERLARGVPAWPFPTGSKPAEGEKPSSGPKARSEPPAPARKSAPTKYRDPDTGATWSGRGLKPAWLRAALDSGKTLADFDVAAGATA
jgi:hypothetical protein